MFILNNIIIVIVYAQLRNILLFTFDYVIFSCLSEYTHIYNWNEVDRFSETWNILIAIAIKKGTFSCYFPNKVGGCWILYYVCVISIYKL